MLAGFVIGACRRSTQNGHVLPAGLCCSRFARPYLRRSYHAQTHHCFAASGPGGKGGRPRQGREPCLGPMRSSMPARPHTKVTASQGDVPSAEISVVRDEHARDSMASGRSATSPVPDNLDAHVDMVIVPPSSDCSVPGASHAELPLHRPPNQDWLVQPSAPTSRPSPWRSTTGHGPRAL